jgi:hypothetical protein
MPHGEVSEIINASAEEVFDLVHDYGRRLEWDTLLRAAYLADGFETVGVGTTNVCVGRRTVGGLSFKTVYVTFDRPRVAAVKLINSPALFRSWAASIRHSEISSTQSRITYTFQFTASPRWLAFLLEPLLAALFRWETRKRLRALRAYMAR